MNQLIMRGTVASAKEFEASRQKGIRMNPASGIMVQKLLDVTTVEFQTPRLMDAKGISTIGEQLYELVEKRDRKKLILDFSKVRFMSSSALGMLVNLHNKSTAIKGVLVLCGLRKDLMKVFEITKLTKILRFCADEKEALAVFGHAGRV